MATMKPAAGSCCVPRGSCGAGGHGSCSACCSTGTVVSSGLLQPNNQPIHPPDCSIQGQLTCCSHNRTLQRTLFKQENRFVLFLKAIESSVGCRGLSCVSLSANKNTRIVEETLEAVFAFSLPWSTSEGSHKKGSHTKSTKRVPTAHGLGCNCTEVQRFESASPNFLVSYF